MDGFAHMITQTKDMPPKQTRFRDDGNSIIGFVHILTVIYANQYYQYVKNKVYFLD